MIIMLQMGMDVVLHVNHKKDQLEKDQFVMQLKIFVEMEFINFFSTKAAMMGIKIVEMAVVKLVKFKVDMSVIILKDFQDVLSAEMVYLIQVKRVMTVTLIVEMVVVYLVQFKAILLVLLIFQLHVL